MQTFLVSPNFDDVGQLDYRRLGKQRVEAKQIYLALTEDAYGWKNHPAVKMWKGYEQALLYYGLKTTMAWTALGYRDSLAPFFGDRIIIQQIELPHWIGDERVYASHRANLLRKDPSFYAQYGWTEDPATPYFWPV
jgi:hypothetical protein